VLRKIAAACISYYLQINDFVIRTQWELRFQGKKFLTNSETAYFNISRYINNYQQYNFINLIFNSPLPFQRTWSIVAQASLWHFGWEASQGKPEGKRPLGRPRRRCMDNTKMDLLEIGLNVVDWIGLAQDRYRWRALVSSVMNLRFHKMLGSAEWLHSLWPLVWYLAPQS
jgi:hypothetical protein